MKSQLTAIPIKQSRSSYKSASVEFEARRFKSVLELFGTNENLSVILRQFAGIACLASCIAINVDPFVHPTKRGGCTFNKHGKKERAVLSFANICEILCGGIISEFRGKT